MASLTELANMHGSDKGTVGPSGTWQVHNYTDLYEAYLSHLRTAPIALLEIGLGVTGVAFEAHIQHGRNAGGGASLKAWRDFFPAARVYGIDINRADHLDGDRVTTFVADQGSVADLGRVLQAIPEPAFDVIIDDGSHRPDHQQVSLGALFPHVKPNGLYIIEDLVDNGVGGRTGGRSAVRNLRDTRSLLRDFQDSGELKGPHALIEPDNLAGAIQCINFHCPAIGVRVRFRRPTALSRRPVVVRPAFESGTERVAVIRKRG